jgi:hypothetical protein
MREHIMYRRNLAFIAAIFLPVLAIAQDQQSYQCTSGELTRRVEIFSEPGVAVPCEVHYYKDTEAPGERQVLWRAQNDAAYCASKAQEFIAKLNDMGWDCGQQAEVDEPVDADESESVDDTDALTPADEIELDDPR